MFVQGQVYRRQELHRSYGGQWQGGISTPSGQPFLFLFTGETGRQYGYRDGWTDEGLFLYSGEGQHGDMAFVRGNRALRDHVAEAKDVHLFEYVHAGHVRYIGQMVCTGFHQRQSADADGRMRQAIVFELSPVAGFEEGAPTAEGDIAPTQYPLATLRERAYAAEAYAATPRERMQIALARSATVRTYVLAHANGVCEGCGAPAPFHTASGRPYLETHHIRRLSDGGPDDPRWVAALCPNCHRRAHYGGDAAQFNQKVGELVGDREQRASVADS